MNQTYKCMELKKFDWWTWTELPKSQKSLRKPNKLQAAHRSKNFKPNAKNMAITERNFWPSQPINIQS